MSLAEISQAIVSHSNLLLVFFATLRDQLHPTLCDSMDCSPPGSSVHGIFQARILEWVAISFSRGFSWARHRTPVSCIGRQILYTEPPGKCSVQFSSVAQSCPTLGNPMNRSTPGLPVHHHLPEFTQTHIHQVSEAIQPSHPLSSPSPPSPIPPSIRVFSNESTLHMRWPKYWSFSFSIIPSKEYPGLAPLEWTVGSPCSPRDSQESSPTPQFKRSASLLHLDKIIPLFC